jgi:thioredoxin 1
MRNVIVCLLLFVVPPLAMLGFKRYQEYQTELRTVPALRSSDEVLFFNASWCGPCRQMKPVVANLRSKGYRLRDVDIDKNQSLAAKYGIHAVPTFVFIHHGSEVNRFSGGTSPENLRELCSNYR